MRFQRFYVAALVLVAVLLVTAGPADILWRLWRISASPVAATAHITRLDCQNHGHVDYAFDVDGAAYTARNPFVDGVQCPALKLGQSVAVYYEKGEPRNNYGFDPAGATSDPTRRALITGIAFNLAALLLMPLLLAGIYRFVSRFTAKPR